MDEQENVPSKATRGFWRRVWSSPWIHLAAALLVIATVHGLIIRPYAVPSGSMEQTLQVGDRIYVNRLAYLQADPQHGDLVVFNASESWGTSGDKSWARLAAGEIGDVLGFGTTNHHTLVKRVIGVPGDVVSCCSANGSLEVNGQPLEEPYIYEDLPFLVGELDCSTSPKSKRCFDPISVTANRYLMMGDHRSNSSDSVTACRGGPESPAETAKVCARFAQRDEIVGKVAFRVWPLSNIRSF